MPTKKKTIEYRPNNLIAALSVVGIVVLAVADLFSINDIPNFIYFGLIGSALGAKFDEIFNIGGRK